MSRSTFTKAGSSMSMARAGVFRFFRLSPVITMKMGHFHSNDGETGSRDPNGIQIPVAARATGDSMIIERPCGRTPAQIRLELSLGNCLSPNNRLRDFKTVRKNHGAWDWRRNRPTEATQGLDTTPGPLPVVFRRRWELRRVSLPAIPPSPATHQWSCPGCTRR